MADVNAIATAVSNSQAQAYTKSMLSGTAKAVYSLIAFLANLFHQLFSLIGIHLPAGGYTIVALFALGATIYYLNKMAWGILKAILIGVAVAIVLSMLGLIG